MKVVGFAKFVEMNESGIKALPKPFDAEGAERFFANMKGSCPDCIPTTARGWHKIKEQIDKFNELSMMDEWDAKMVIQDFNREAGISDDVSWYDTIMAYILDGGNYKQSIYEINDDIVNKTGMFFTPVTDSRLKDALVGFGFPKNWWMIDKLMDIL